MQHFIAKCNNKLGSKVIGVSPEAMEMLMKYDWPGNVRELEHALEGAAVAIEEGLVYPQHLPAYLQQAAPPAARSPLTLSVNGSLPVREALRGAEEQMVRSALDNSGGNVSRAARMLGIPRQTLQRKLKSMGISRGAPRSPAGSGSM